MYYIMTALEILLDKSSMCNMSSLAFLGCLLFILVEIFLILAIINNSQLNFGHIGYYFIESGSYLNFVLWKISSETILVEEGKCYSLIQGFLFVFF